MLKFKKVATALVCVILAFAILYSIAVFSDIPFIKKWRTIYIETAMTTLNHKWLATSFIPEAIINEVMNDAAAKHEEQQEIESLWKDDDKTMDIESTIRDDVLIEVPDESLETEVLVPEEPIPEETEPPIDYEAIRLEELKNAFYDTYWEIDREKLELYVSKNNLSYENLLIENMDFSIDISTTFGERIKIIDVENGLIIVEITGEGYKGLLATAKNPKQVTVAKADSLGTFGNLAGKMAKDNNALLAINASGFADEGWVGNGGTIAGSMILDGVEYGNPSYAYKLFGFKKNDYRMYIEKYSPEKTKDYAWGIQFSPALIVDGKQYVDSSFGYGIHPRSAVGQTQTGEFLMLVIDGRQVGHSIGATVADVAEIMLRHNAYQAMNLDGGSSSIMIYKNETINSPSSNTNAGRYIPNAFILKYAEDIKNG